MSSMTRGPLPPGVYWRRRLFVLALAATLVFLVASLLRGGSDGASDEVPVARQAGAEVEASQTVTVEPKGDREGRRERRRERRTGPTLGPTYDPDVLAEPDGFCEPEEVRVTPRVDEAVAGRDVTIGLSFQSTESAACTWRLKPRRVLVRITAGDEEIWTSRECRKVIPEQTVVVRDVVATVVEITWNGRESDSHCPAESEWVMAGDYSVAAAVLGGEPDYVDFELLDPTPETVTPEAESDEESDSRRGDRRRDRDARRGQGQDEDIPIR